MTLPIILSGPGLYAIIFSFFMDCRPPRGREIDFFITFFACAKKVTKESTPREGIPSGSLLLPRGGGTWLYGSVIRHHIVSARRGSIRTPLPRLCKVGWSPVGVAVEFAAGDRGGTRLCATGREVSGKTRTPCLQGAIGGKKISNLYKHNAAVGNLSG